MMNAYSLRILHQFDYGISNLYKTREIYWDLIMNPDPIMQLSGIIRGYATSDATYESINN